MSSELTILALFGLLTIVQMLVHVLTAQSQLGMDYLVTPRDQPRELTGLAGRARRAADNSIVAMTLFAPAILILQAKAAFSPSTLIATQLFLIARLVYAVVYPLGTPWIRTGVWLVGFLATLYLYICAI
ncbi:MAG: hypothetical protein DI533_14170 [Cereibacter sphaeroides]|uniref:MAPEG family protein n=1 Tax=Cereibacter sphaeroides TaxID=1063 RepID=A0A2W5UFE7_CERSP|nr:MAG: hypothetical protein DI533_14170 [Cereibacter sphaeroides]